jgi:hypothetical protein
MQENSNIDEKLSRIIKGLSESGRDLTIAEIMASFGTKGLPLATLFFIAPFLQPIPIPGISSVFGVLIGLCGIGIFFSKSIWLPKQISKVIVKSEWLIKIGSAAHYIVTKVETISKPRAPNLVRATRMLTGFLLLLLGLFLALPLFLPFSNFIPGVIIFALAIGLAEEDFLFILLGYISFIIGAIALYAATDLVIQWLKQYL